MDFILVTIGLIIIVFLGGVLFDGKKGSRFKAGKKAVGDESQGIVVWIIFGGMICGLLFFLSIIF